MIEGSKGSGDDREYSATMPSQRLVLALLLLLGTGSASTARAWAACKSAFVRGDANVDKKVDLSDPIFLLRHLFQGGDSPPCLDAGDADDNGKLDLSDAVFTVGYLFQGGAPLPPPSNGACGEDPTEDQLDCSSFAACAAEPRDGCESSECCEPDDYCIKREGDCFGLGVCVPRPAACDALFDPVCGCDGNSYENSCAAALAGVSVAHHGKCGALEGCLSSAQCDIDSFCNHPEGLCDEPGACTLLPAACKDDVVDPVCGCDEQTYDNACLAQQAGVSINYRGPCRGRVECSTNEECPFPEYCEKADGFCVEPGVCALRPDLCALNFNPVCGCDGVTYTNECQARASGVNLSARGPCGGGAECKSSEECEVDSYCAKIEGFCDGPGFCQKRPADGECDGLPGEPVCGCDGITYDTPCRASQAGTGIARRGTCDLGKICASNDDCLAELFCMKKEGLCAEPGYCVPDYTPASCVGAEEQPVCGCDDVTYKNPCEAYLAGMNIAYYGACDGLDHCSRNEECGDDSYCQFKEGQCGAFGLCAKAPVECPGEDAIDPVCGCDGKTYLNECDAQRNKMSIAFRGRCERGGPQDCTGSQFCGPGAFCKKAPGDCDGNGECTPKPTSCEDVDDPVCGCDGITYRNQCYAELDGVNVLQTGACP